MNMRYYVIYDENNKLIAVGIGEDGIEISEEEYDRLLNEIREKADFAERLYLGEITLDGIPEEWREEIEQRVNERISAGGKADEQEISAEEALNIILGGEAV